MANLNKNDSLSFIFFYLLLLSHLVNTHLLRMKRIRLRYFERQICQFLDVIQFL